MEEESGRYFEIENNINMVWYSLVNHMTRKYTDESDYLNRYL